MQGLFSQQYGQPNPINLYTDAQQIKDNYDNRKITEDDVLSIMTSWEVYDDDIPYSDVRAFLKELLTWEEVEYLEKWYGTGLQGRLHINLIGNCPPDGVASFWISFTASARPVWKDTIKHDTLFEKYASRLGSYNEEFFEGLEVNEDKISFTDYGAVMWEKVEYEGIDWSIGTHSVKEMDDRVTLVAFTASPASFDEMAAGYLRMLEFLKGIYGEPTEVTQEVSNIEQLREVYNKTLNFHPDAAAIWNFDQADDVDPQVWYRMNELVKTDYETETIRRIYGSDAVPKANFHIQLYCDAGEGTSDDNGVISTFYSYELTIIFSIKITPEHS